MAKILKLEAAVNANFDQVVVRVSQQTHIRYAFGNNPADLRKFVASNGIVLASNERPARDTSDKNTIWVKGNASATKNATSFIVSKATYEKLKAAVVEYNFYNSDEQVALRNRGFGYRTTVPAIPAPTRCTEIVG